MELLHEPQAWLAFLVLATLEIILGIDNVIFLSILVDRLPQPRRRSARLLGLGFAMLTRLALLFSVTWVTTLRGPLLSAGAFHISGRQLILFAGGVFLAVGSAWEIRRIGAAPRAAHPHRPTGKFWLIVVQVGILDIVFSLDSVFTAVGLANRIEIMVAAIVLSIPVMLAISAAIGALIERYPTIELLALSYLVLVGGAMVGDAVGWNIPKGYLYVAMALMAGIEYIKIRMRARNTAP
jgi:predicted tellurium resistance membrane protein TerC